MPCGHNPSALKKDHAWAFRTMVEVARSLRGWLAKKDGAGWVIRTPDLYITNVPLYQLS